MDVGKCDEHDDLGASFTACHGRVVVLEKVVSRDGANHVGVSLIWNIYNCESGMGAQIAAPMNAEQSVRDELCPQ